MAVATKQKPRSTVHHKKRHGNHQRRSTHFMKAYWPYLPIALIVGVGMLVNTLWMKPGVLSYATNMTHTGLLVSTNSERAKHNLGTLSLNQSLTEAAQKKAADMVARNYWSHVTPDGQDPWVFINTTGYTYLAAGENLAYGFTDYEDAVIGWMNSPGHRANILNNEYSEVGFGIANSANFQGNGEQTVVVAMYAKPYSSVAGNPNTSPLSTSTDSSPATTAQQPSNSNQPIAVGRNTTGENQNEITVSATVPGEQKVARVQIATSGAAPWSILAASFLAIGLLVIFIMRHSLAWHRVVVRGEAFFLKHKVLDIFIVSGVVMAAVLSQTAGFIQ